MATGRAAVVVLLWCWLSLTWSSMPATAVRRLGLTTAVTGTIMVSISRLGYRNALALVRWPLAIMLLLSLGVIFALPDIGIREWQGLKVWRGLLADKNIAGTFCALTIILSTPMRSRSHKCCAGVCWHWRQPS